MQKEIWSCFGHTSIAIVGSRECSDYGFRQAYEFAKELSKKGICVISGLAVGIDTASHLGAMHQIGKTIVVLGSGLNRIYPKENKILSSSIIKNGGLIVTEYDFNEEIKPENFPKRNRIMSGISDGILVIEARKRSGTLITVRHAKKQGKELFCLPGNISNKSSIGSNELIKNGAKMVTDVNDILEELVKKSQVDIGENEINSEYKTIYNILTDVPMHINEICKRVNSPIAEVNQIITMLEIEGLIQSLPNNEFIKR